MADIDILSAPIGTAVYNISLDENNQPIRSVPAGGGSFVSKTGDTMTGPLVLSGDPNAALQAATKQYVDNMVQGLSPKRSVKVSTTGNLILTGLQTIDGVAVTNGDRVLVKNQTSSSENGIWVASTTAWQRSNDANSWDELVSAFVFVDQGTTGADKAWVCTVNAGGTLDTNAVTWVAFGSIAGLAPLDNPAFTGNPTAPTPTAGDNDTSIATTAFVTAAVAALSTVYEPLGRISALDAKTGNYTAVLTDAGRTIEMNVATANTFTVPPNSSIAFPLNTRIDVVQMGAGVTTITPGAGVTIRSNGAKYKTNGQYAGASLYKRGTDEWVVMGNLST